MKEIYRKNHRIAVYHNDDGITFLDESGEMVNATTTLQELTEVMAKHEDSRMQTGVPGGFVEIDYLKICASTALYVLVAANRISKGL